jgi:hypothetical protein
MEPPGRSSQTGKGSHLGKRSRDTGKVGERFAASLLKPVYPKAARNKDQFEGAKQPDVLGTPFWVEVKYWKQYPNIHAALEQAVSDAKEVRDVRPIVAITKKKREVGKPNSGKPWTATMYVKDFVSLLSELEYYRRKASGE